MIDFTRVFALTAAACLLPLAACEKIEEAEKVYAMQQRSFEEARDLLRRVKAARKFFPVEEKALWWQGLWPRYHTKFEGTFIQSFVIAGSFFAGSFIESFVKGWLRMIALHAPRVPVVLVGTQKDTVKSKEQHMAINKILRRLLREACCARTKEMMRCVHIMSHLSSLPRWHRAARFLL